MTIFVREIAIFRFLRLFFKVTILTNANGLIYTRDAAIPLPHDTAAQVGQIYPDRYWLGCTP